MPLMMIMTMIINYDDNYDNDYDDSSGNDMTSKRVEVAADGVSTSPLNSIC